MCIKENDIVEVLRHIHDSIQSNKVQPPHYTKYKKLEALDLVVDLLEDYPMPQTTKKESNT